MRGIIIGVLAGLLGLMAVCGGVLTATDGAQDGWTPRRVGTLVGGGAFGASMLLFAGYSVYNGINEIRDSAPAPRRRKRRRPPPRRREDDRDDEEDDRPRRRRKRRFEDDDED